MCLTLSESGGIENGWSTGPCLQRLLRLQFLQWKGEVTKADDFLWVLSQVLISLFIRTWNSVVFREDNPVLKVRKLRHRGAGAWLKVTQLMRNRARTLRHMVQSHRNRKVISLCLCALSTRSPILQKGSQKMENNSWIRQLWRFTGLEHKTAATGQKSCVIGQEEISGRRTATETALKGLSKSTASLSPKSQ